MPNTHGGARPGAGRKPKAETYQSEIQTFNDACARSLLQRFDALDALAEGAERTEERYELALSIMVDSFEENPSGAKVKVKRQLFPDAGENDMKLVERKVITLEPDRAANEYLVDRILGKPVASVELTGADGEALSLRPDLSVLSTEELTTLLPLLKKASTADIPHDPDIAGG